MPGFLLITKPPGPTSFDVVAKIRRLTGEKRVGHAGTLDPFASGLLIVAVGRDYTKQLSDFVGLDKEYEAEICLGATSTTGDPEGIIIKTNSMIVTPAPEPGSMDERGSRVKPGMTTQEIEKVLRSFIGPQLQTPPMYSAKKVAGQKLYSLARKGVVIERKPVSITIHAIELLNYSWPLLTIKARVSSGTYLRTLGEDIGRALGTGAYLTKLRRTSIGPYRIEQALNFSELGQNPPNFKSLSE
ncbi:MAG: tRNA pseudouridine(55) synthase TruB [bacterium]